MKPAFLPKKILAISGHTEKEKFQKKWSLVLRSTRKHRNTIDGHGRVAFLQQDRDSRPLLFVCTDIASNASTGGGMVAPDAL
jgi:hypothetical protein